MLRRDFDLFWDRVFEPHISRILSDNNGAIRDATVPLQDSLYAHYQKQRADVHQAMRQPGGRIDRHKIAAIFCRSVIELDPFECGAKDNAGTIAQRLLKELIGFRVGLLLLSIFNLEIQKKYPDRLDAQIISQRGLQLPNSEHEPYEDQVLKMLYYARITNNFNTYKLANIYFLIESYSVEFWKKSL